MPSPLPNSQTLNINQIGNLLGERPSLNSYAGVPDGVTDNRTQLQTLINDVSTAGGGVVYIPYGTYALSNYITVPANVWLVGGGVTSILARIPASTITTGYGLITITGSNVRISDLLIEGNVTTSSVINFSSISTPEDTALISNTSIWLQPGISHIRFSDLTIQHTGGYGVFIDVRTASSYDIRFSSCYFTNNRPHNFTDGTNVGGSWTGGVYVSGNCTSSYPYALSGIRFTDSHWSRNSGNCIWSHSNGFYVQHSDLRVSDCDFTDCGLDAVQFGNILGGGVTNCSFRRIGYLCSSDSANPVPAYVANHGPVAIDTSGYASGIAHANNSMISINGYGYNLDGMRDSTINGGTIYIPIPSDPAYTTDSVSSFGVGGVGPQVTKGIETGNTSQNGGSQRIYITNVAISNCNQISISLVFAKYCYVSNCPITSTSTITPPIVITAFSGGTGTEFYAFSNTVINNPINYNQPNVCIAESPNPASGIIYNNSIGPNQILQ